MKDPKVSIIVPIYKVEKYLTNCIETLVNQTYKNIEIVLVDDGSPDGCPKMCDEWATKDSRIKVVHKQNGGLMNAWKDGVTVSTGELIAFVDSDDYVELEYVEVLVDTLIKNNADISVCDYYDSCENEKIVRILYLTEGDSERYLLQCKTLQLSFEIEMNKELSEEIKSDCRKKELAGYWVYYQETPQYIQAYFGYQNNLYLISSDTEDNLFRIIENLKEIN